MVKLIKNNKFIILLILFLFINLIVYFIIKNYFSKYLLFEGLKSMNSEFCESHKGNSVKLNEMCNKLTQNNCNNSSCCVWTSQQKCVAGNNKGPTFNSDINGKTEPLDYYYFENKCYGSKCPST